MAKTLRTKSHPDFETKGQPLTHEEGDDNFIEIYETANSMRILSGEGEPNNSDGVDGNWYFQTEDGVKIAEWQKRLGEWVRVASISGGTVLSPVHDFKLENLGDGIVRVSFSHPDEGDPQLYFDYQINGGQVMTTQETMIEVDTNEL